MPTAYSLFCKEKRGDVEKKNPDATYCQIAKILMKMWNELTEEMKQSYYEQAKPRESQSDSPMMHRKKKSTLKDSQSLIDAMSESTDSASQKTDEEFNEGQSQSSQSDEFENEEFKSTDEPDPSTQE